MSEKKITHRGFMLPFVEYDDDSMGLGIPAIIHDMFASNNRGIAAQDRVGRYREDGTMITGGDVARATAGDVLNVAGAAPIGGVAARAVGAMPDNALGTGGANIAKASASAGSTGSIKNDPMMLAMAERNRIRDAELYRDFYEKGVPLKQSIANAHARAKASGKSLFSNPDEASLTALLAELLDKENE